MEQWTRSVSTQPVLLKDQAYHAIKKGILKEIFKPGHFLSEKQLIDYLGMSKTPIKSAVDRLEAEGFLAVSPKQGILVKELSLEKVANLFDLRMALEMFVAEQLSGTLTEAQCVRIDVNLAQQLEHARAGDDEQFTYADAEFHMLLCEFSGNEEIVQVMRNNQDHLHRFALRVLKRVPNRMEQAYRDHQQMVEAMKQGRAEETVRLVREHLQFGKGTLLR